MGISVLLLALVGHTAAFTAFTAPQMCRSRTSQSVLAMSATAKKEGHGSMAGVADKNSFVQGEMRRVAMSLHSKQDAPKEGEQENKGPPPNKWAPTLEDYLQFLVDSRHVYSRMEDAVAQDPVLEPYRSSGLERAEALDKDIDWLVTEKGCSEPAVGEPGKAYVDFLDELIASGNIPAFMCHYYNHYFAHTAGGRMIGKMMSEKLLDGQTLNFYQWDGEVKEHLESVRRQIDIMADTWSREEKDACLAETGGSFKKSGALLSHLAKA